jgi:tetratricopeptide (TPR) repeat protein
MDRTLPCRAALVAVALLALVRPAAAITAGEARTKSFKLQSEGMKLHREGRYPEAIEALQQAVNLQLNSFMAWYYLGLCLSAERRYGEAIEPLKTALDLQPDYIQAHVALGDAHLKLGEINEARAAYLRALEQQQNYAAAHDGMGRLLESTGKDDEAETAYRKALEINVAYADAYTHLGEMYLRRGRLDDATNLFLKAITVKPDFSQAYTRLGVALSRLGRYDDAIAASRKSFQLAPRDPEPHIALARIAIELQTLARARASLDAARALDADNPYVAIVGADLERARADPGAAVALLEERLARPIDEPRLKRAIVESLERARRERDALATLGAAAATSPDDPQAHAALARLYTSLRAHGRAAEEYLVAADRASRPPAAGPPPAADPPPAGRAGAQADAAGLRFDAGLAFLSARRFAEAIAALDEVARSAPEEGMRLDALFDSGVARARAGLDAAAEAVFRDYLARRPADAEAHLYLGNALLRLGRKDEARREFDSYLETAAPGPDADRVRRLTTDLGTRPGGAS